MNEDYYEQNSCYYPNSSSFDQYQPPQSPDNHQFPQETSNEILQARDDLMERYYMLFKQTNSRQEDIQELMSKLLEDVRNISEEFSEYINCLSWNRSLFYFDDDDDEYIVIWRRPKAITPDEPIEEPDNSLSMGDEHLDTIFSVEILILSDSNDDDTSSDDDDFEDIEYDSLKEENEDQEEKKFDLEDILQIQDVILLIRSLEESDTLSFSFGYFFYPAFESFSDHTEEEEDEKWHSTTTMLLPLYSRLPEFESFYFDDPSFPRPPSEPPDVEICLHFEPDAPVIDNFNELNDDQRGSEYWIFLKMLKLTLILSHLSFRYFSPRFSPTPRFLLYLAPPGVKTPFLTPTSPLRAGGISSGWNLHVL
ncbi:hypothetical protein Tco_0413222 [Tanacetum coccineum]